MSLSVDSVGSNSLDSLQGSGAGNPQALQALAKIEQIIQELIAALQMFSKLGDNNSPSAGGGGGSGGGTGGMPSFPDSGGAAPQSLAATPGAGSPAAGTGDGSATAAPSTPAAADSSTPSAAATSAPPAASTDPAASTAVQSTPAASGGDMTPQQVASQYKNEIASASQATGVPPGIIAGQIWQESKGIANTPGGGLMQLGPNEFQKYGGGDISNPADNIRAGAAYMKDLSTQFGGNMGAALRAYNSGPNGVDLANLNSTPAGTGDPTYVQKVMQAAQQSGLATA
ncbi:lytic transglycosylase domain-containing protein [Burkholderia sp. 22PA0099]|uniref:lytic transglycosylase domain-containing protein n=1 Tax=Burkholderia sp. 22PA0099 TaxID=3237372 RepID=UPI0039C04C49